MLNLESEYLFNPDWTIDIWIRIESEASIPIGDVASVLSTDSTCTSPNTYISSLGFLSTDGGIISYAYLIDSDISLDETLEGTVVNQKEWNHIAVVSDTF